MPGGMNTNELAPYFIVFSPIVTSPCPFMMKHISSESKCECLEDACPTGKIPWWTFMFFDRKTSLIVLKVPVFFSPSLYPFILSSESTVASVNYSLSIHQHLATNL